MSLITDLRDSRELWRNLTLRELKGKYRRTALGQLWSLLNPLAAMVIYTLVFSFLLRIQPEPGNPSGLNIFALWLLCGLLPWTFLANVLNGGMGAIIGNANLIQKVYFPRFVLVVSTASAWAVTWAIEMAVLVLVLMMFGGSPLLYLPVALFAMALLAAFALGLGLALSVANAYFRDTQHLVGILLQVWFYLTPILYPLSYVADQQVRLAEQYGWEVPLVALFRLNPMERFAEVFRNLLYDNRLPEWGDLAYCGVLAMLSLIVGIAVFRRFEGRLAEEL